MRFSVGKVRRMRVHIACLAALVVFWLVTNHILQKLESSQQDLASHELIQKEESLPLRTKKIENLIQKYKFDLDVVIDDSPWAVAAKWAKAREIHPSHVPELGK